MNQKIETKLGVTIILIIAITVGAFLWTLKKKQVAIDQTQGINNTKRQITQTNKAVVDQKNILKQNKQTNIAGISNVESYSVDDFLDMYNLLPSEDKDIIKNVTYYNVIAKNPGKNYAIIYFVKDGSQNNVIYFIDTRFEFKNSLPRPIIYRLYLKNGELAKIYESQNTINSFELSGRMGRKLLFFKKGFDDSPGPCFNIWVDAYKHPLPRSLNLLNSNDGKFYQGNLRTIQSIDVNDTKIGFSNFIIPKEKYEAELSLQNDCMNNFK